MVRDALAEWSNVANITFVEQGSDTLFAASTADMAFAPTGSRLQRDLGAVGLGVFPSTQFARNLASSLGYSQAAYPRPEGDVFFDDLPSGKGGAGYVVLLHEIGHALGLKHTSDDGANGRPTYASLGLSSFENEQYTVMSLASSTLEQSFAQAITPMVFDLLAIQRLYGANTSYHAGDDTYTLNDLGPGLKRTIWDTGGIDTLAIGTFEPYPYRGFVFDLRPGAGVVGTTSSYTAIAYGTVIENARTPISSSSETSFREALRRLSAAMI